MEDRRAEKTKNEKMFNGWSWLKRENLSCWQLATCAVSNALPRGSPVGADTHFLLLFTAVHTAWNTTQASACSRLDRLNWGGRECVIAYPLTFVSRGHWGLSVRPRLYLSFSFLGTVYFCKGMYLSSKVFSCPCFSFDSWCIYCMFITESILICIFSSLKRKRTFSKWCRINALIVVLIPPVLLCSSAEKKTTKNNFWFLMTIKDSISLNFVNRRRFTNEAIGRTHSVQWPFMYDQPSCLHCEYDDGQPFKSQCEDNNYIHPSHVPVSSLSVNTSFGCRREKRKMYTVTSFDTAVLSIFTREQLSVVKEKSASNERIRMKQS